MITAPTVDAAELRPKSLSPSLKHGLRALAVAGDEFEPFVDWIIGSTVIEQLLAMGLAEKGDSNRPSVGPIGYRLTELGRQSVGAFWRCERTATRIALSLTTK